MTDINRDPSAWIRRFHPAPQAACGLLCLPHAGGSASYFFPASRALAPGIEVLPVQYPGRQERRFERRIEDLRELAGYVFDAVRPFTGRPLGLFGHSMGATLAFEVALRMEREGIPPAVVFASGRRAPSVDKHEDVHTRPDSGLLEELRELSGTDAELLTDKEFIPVILNPLRSDYRAVESYRCPPGVSLSCPVVAMVGDDDPKAEVDDVALWSEHTTGPFELRVFPGGHFYLNDHAAEVTELIAARMPSAVCGRG
jgi:pyochelin biosynthesis protein PchC